MRSQSNPSRYARVTHGVRDCSGSNGAGSSARPMSRHSGARKSRRRVPSRHGGGGDPLPFHPFESVRLPCSGSLGAGASSAAINFAEAWNRCPWSRSIRTSRSRALARLARRYGPISASTSALTAAVCALSMKRSSWSCSRVWRNRVLNSAFSRGSADAARTVPAFSSQP